MSTREALVAAGVFLALAVSAQPSYPDNCRDELHMEPVHPVDTRLSCKWHLSPNEMLISLEGNRTKFLNIHCLKKAFDNTCDDIPEFDFSETLEELDFFNCPVEVVSMACVSRRLRVKDVAKLTVHFLLGSYIKKSRTNMEQLQGPRWISFEGTSGSNRDEWTFTKESLTPWSALERLTLNNIDVTLNPGALAGLRSLTTFDLISTRLTGVNLPPGEFARLPALKELNLSDSNMTIAHVTFENLTSLEVLTVSSQPISSLDGTVLAVNFPRLRKLSVSRANLELLRPLEPLQHLEKLDISQCQRDTLELSLRALGALPRLEHVTMRWCKVRALPADLFVGSKSLISLDLRHNQLSALPASLLADQRKVQDLDFSFNELKTLPQELFSSLEGLQRLNLAANRLKEFPDQYLERLPLIRMLDVGNNPLFCDSRLYQLALRVVESVGDATLPRVVARGAICSGPPALRGLLFTNVGLHKLCVPGCRCSESQYSVKMECTTRLDSLPQQFSVLPLELKLQHAPASLAWLPSNVETLDLSNLNMAELPADLNLSAIRDLDLSGNRLTRVPVEILAANVTAKLARNPLACDCAHAPGIVQLNAFRALVEDYVAVACSDGLPVQQVDLCRSRWWWWLIGGTLLVLLGLAGILLLRYPQQLKNHCNLQQLYSRCVDYYNGKGGDDADSRVGFIPLEQ